MKSPNFIAPDFSDERLGQSRNYDLVIGSKDPSASDGRTFERESPAHTGIKVGTYALGSAADVDAAVAAARNAFDNGAWPRMTAVERSKAMLRVAALMEKNLDELATVEALEGGKPIAQARAEVGGCIDLWEYAAGQVRGLSGEILSDLAPEVLGLVVREPIGVVGIITPWNFPLAIACERLPWVIGVGNSVVIKPSEFTSGTTLILGRLIREAGIPEGVVNVVTGYGDPVGDAISRHPGIDMVSFTGSLRVGKLVGAAAADTVKRVGLELGGKGPQLIFSDADIDAAVDGAAFGLLFNNGQCCISGSRVIVEESIAEDFMSRLEAAVSKVVYGDPLNEKTMVGSIINESQYSRIADYVEQGNAAGARLLSGGQKMGEGKGLYYAPTLFGAVGEQMSIAREEIFGPVLSILTFKDEADGVRIANDSEYGLSASVWTRDLQKGLGTIRKIRAGKTFVNGVIASYPEMSFGGFKQSGNGRETGKLGFDQYSEFKAIHMNYGPRDPWIKG